MFELDRSGCNSDQYSIQTGGQGTDGCILIISHHAAVTLDINTENRTEPALTIFLGAGVIPFCYGFKQREKLG